MNLEHLKSSVVGIIFLGFLGSVIATALSAIAVKAYGSYTKFYAQRHKKKYYDLGYISGYSVGNIESGGPIFSSYMTSYIMKSIMSCSAFIATTVVSIIIFILSVASPGIIHLLGYGVSIVFISVGMFFLWITWIDYKLVKNNPQLIMEAKKNQRPQEPLKPVAHKTS
jgi:hypothetical protein